MVPPAMGPNAGAITATVITLRDAIDRSSMGNALNNSADPTGVINPADAPWSARPMTSWLSDCARPHNNDVTTKPPSAIMNARRSPSRFPNQPAEAVITARAMVNESTVQSMAVASTLNSSARVGNATLMIVPSMICMNKAAMYTAATRFL